MLVSEIYYVCVWIMCYVCCTTIHVFHLIILYVNSNDLFSLFRFFFVLIDLHPGNIILTKPELGSVELCFIDAGLVVSLEDDDRRNLIDLFKAVITNDGSMVGRLMVERSRRAVKVIDPEGFCSAMEAIVKHVHDCGMQLSKIGVSDLLQEVLGLCYKHQVKLEPRFASVIIAMGVVEGVGRQLDPDCDILRCAAPFVMRASVIANAPKDFLPKQE